MNWDGCTTKREWVSKGWSKGIYECVSFGICKCKKKNRAETHYGNDDKDEIFNPGTGNAII